MKDFIQCFASESPVCSYFPSNDDFNSHMRALCLTTATGMAIGSNINAMTFIQKNAPIIFNILATIQSSPLPNVWKILFLLLGRISKQSCDKKPHTLPEATVAQKKNTLAYFPNWPVQCSRGSYYQDKSKKNEGPHCKKDKKKTTLLPGLFTIYCEHGKGGVIFYFILSMLNKLHVRYKGNAYYATMKLSLTCESCMSNSLS